MGTAKKQATSALSQVPAAADGGRFRVQQQRSMSEIFFQSAAEGQTGSGLLCPAAEAGRDLLLLPTGEGGRTHNQEAAEIRRSNSSGGASGLDRMSLLRSPQATRAGSSRRSRTG